MRTCTVAAALAVAVAASACGDDAEPPRREPLVELALTAPADAHVTRALTVEVSGTVKPGRAVVQVLGDDVAVDDGRFSAEVELEPGANLIDVAGSASGHRPDFATLRVVREQRVPLPDVVGRDPDAAQEELEALGLKVRREISRGLLDPLLPREPQVCEMDPGAAEPVLPGTEVTLRIARFC